MECISPLSMFALSRLDMARTVQLRSALRLLLGHFLDGPSDFSSVASSEQSFRRFMNSVKYLQKQATSLNLPLHLLCLHAFILMVQHSFCHLKPSSEISRFLYTMYVIPLKPEV